ncbi:MAG: Aspartokinase [uncultured Sphingomonadaceae bacterium]|uniref:Aspartokinase n=1 Tax=uncultured Sphingomonadaceae bacterium TaxID=169976 RepID=A0A6J4SZL8_9SPHN|nr:MAG: Aspartokinase [uncultured Sphingomonadaceae bacterium]
MSRIVMKFGGTSMAGIERIRAVAARVKAEAEAGNQVCVVVSAMAGETDRLIQFCREASSLYDPREYDVVVASGEQVTSGLLAITLQGMGLDARSWMGWQLLRTDSAHGNARINAIDGAALDASLETGQIAVVPGFQGISGEGRVATLGRGGSDTSAVAMAAELNADRCDIYTDVDGVYTTDPRIVPRARLLPAVTYEEMLELASVGAKVLQTRSVGLAMRERLRLRVLSSFEDAPGTMIVPEEELRGYGMERLSVTGVAYDKNEAKVTLTGVADAPGAPARIFAPLAEAGVNVDVIVQNVPGPAGTINLTFTVPAAELPRALDLLERERASIGFQSIAHDSDICKVSVVGVGMRSNAGVAATMFKALGDRGIAIHAITTSEVRVSVLIPKDYTELAVRVLHTAYGLDAEDA